MILGVIRGTSMNNQGRSAVPIPDVFDGPFGQVLAQLIERGGDDGAGRRIVPPPREVAPGGLEAGILNEHRDGTSNLYMTIALLWRAAALARGRAKVQFPNPSRDRRLYRQLFGGCWLPGEGGVDRLVQLMLLALAQVLIRDLNEFLDEIDRRGGITHRRPPEAA